jgi:uncharacterized membrane protein YesL
VASRAERAAVAPADTPPAADGGDQRSRLGASGAPSLRRAIRASLGDAYYHSWRLLPANVVWAAAAILIATLSIATPAGLLLAPVLALPTAGIFRVTTRIARGEAVSFWDAVDAWRIDAIRTLAVGAVLVLVTGVLTFNVVTGLGSASPLGWGLATFAAWGLVATWLLAWTAWPIVTDPARAARPYRERLRLAALLVLAHPLRIASLGAVLAAFLVVSAIAIVALVTISVSLAGLLASEFVLPAADRLDTELTRRHATGEKPTAVSSGS